MSLFNNIEINNKNYKFILIDINQLTLFLNNNSLKESFIQIIKEHKSDYSIEKLINDSKKLSNKITNFFILYKKNTVVHIERFVYMIKSNSTYLDFIHTNISYRKKGIANACLYLLISKTKNKFKTYELKVRKSNCSAIKLYKNNNFKIISIIQQENNNKTIDVLIMKLLI
tara:strand:+ start:20 stop:532 length:513 start_codon:yes stop_codon:yes gene_type:complete